MCARVRAALPRAPARWLAPGRAPRASQSDRTRAARRPDARCRPRSSFLRNRLRARRPLAHTPYNKYSFLTNGGQGHPGAPAHAEPGRTDAAAAWWWPGFAGPARARDGTVEADGVAGAGGAG